MRRRNLMGWIKGFTAAGSFISPRGAVSSPLDRGEAGRGVRKKRRARLTACGGGGRGCAVRAPAAAGTRARCPER